MALQSCERITSESPAALEARLREALLDAAFEFSMQGHGTRLDFIKEVVSDGRPRVVRCRRCSDLTDDPFRGKCPECFGRWAPGDPGAGWRDRVRYVGVRLRSFLVRGVVR